MMALGAGYYIVRIPDVSGAFTDRAIDSLNGVFVYYNGPVSRVGGRHIGPDDYNYGLKWQCVEFVKRYYDQYLHHQMPNSYGNAKDFFDKGLPDASYNEQRGLVQYANPSLKKPMVDDIVVFDRNLLNRYGHIAIICSAGSDYIEIIQQNAGPDEATRERIPMVFEEGRWHILNRRALGWLRIE